MSTMHLDEALAPSEAEVVQAKESLRRRRLI